MGNLHEPGAVLLDRLAAATSRHDLDALVSCFAPEYRNETPAHPAQGFTGRDQVRRNWEQIFTFVPDITATVLRSCSNGQVVWSEWQMTGTSGNGAPMQMAGVIIFGIRDDQFTWARFYLEPVQAGGADVNETVRQRVGAESVPGPGTGPAPESGRPGPPR
jgi:ketosteroid isomerase-like protein